MHAQQYLCVSSPGCAEPELVKPVSAWQWHINCDSTMYVSSGHNSSSNEQLHRVTEAAAVTHTKVSPMTVTLA
eukprot:17642-Heterococcus_DN1.PRE.1